MSGPPCSTIRRADFPKLISHEFRTPLNGLLGVGELILERLPACDERDDLEGMFKRSRRRILSILDDKRSQLVGIDVNGEALKSAPVSLSVALSRAMERTAEFAESRQVTLLSPSTELEVVMEDETLLVRALEALLETAVKFSLKGGTVRLGYDVSASSRRLTIDSHGRTIPVPALAKIFDLFSISDAITPGGDLGVGLPFGGMRILPVAGFSSLSVANRESSGIVLIVSLNSVACSNREQLAGVR